MRHRIKNRKLGRTTPHRKAMFSNMAVALLTHEQIETTLHKAKEIRPIVERLITLAKNNQSLHARRQLLASLKDKAVVEKVLTVLGPRYKTRPGGYLRIIKTGFRQGDNAAVAVIEFVERDVNAKGTILGLKEAA